MISLSRLRQTPQFLFHSTIERSFSSISPSISSESNPNIIKWPGPFSPSSRSQSRPILARLKSETNPLRILDILRSSSLNPDAHIDRICFSIAISKLAEAKHFQEIRNFLEELKTSNDFRNNEEFACHVIIWYGQANMLEDAVATFERLENFGVKSLHALLVACVISKDYDELCRVFTEFPRRYGIEANIDVYNLGIKGFCILGKSSEGYVILNEMDKKGVRPDEGTFGNLLAGFYNEEKLEDVGKVLKMMVHYGIKPGIITYNTRIQSLCKMGKSDEALVLLDGMVSRGVKPNSASYCHLIHGFCKEGKFNSAIKLFGDMRTRGVTPSAACHFTLISFLCEGERFDKALDATKRCIKFGWLPPYSVMARLVNGLISMSRFDDAKSLIKSIKQKFKINNVHWDEIEAKLAS